MYVDHGTDPENFRRYREEHADELFEREPSPYYRGTDMSLGHEVTLKTGYGKGTVVPLWEGHDHGGKDPGLFWNGSEW